MGILELRWTPWIEVATKPTSHEVKFRDGGPMYTHSQISKGLIGNFHRRNKFQPVPSEIFYVHQLNNRISRYFKLVLAL